jgi:hypothetical protein
MPTRNPSKRKEGHGRGHWETYKVSHGEITIHLVLYGTRCIQEISKHYEYRTWEDKQLNELREYFKKHQR